MIRNVNAAMTLNELKMRNVAPAIWRNSLIRKASKAEKKILPTLPNTADILMGAKSVRSKVDLPLRNKAGIMANIVHGMATHTDSSRTPASAPSGNQLGSYRITQNHGAITHAHWPINWATAMIWVRSWKSSLISYPIAT